MRLKHDTKKNDTRYSVSATFNGSFKMMITVRKRETNATGWTVIASHDTTDVNRFTEYDKIEQTVLKYLNLAIGYDQTFRSNGNRRLGVWETWLSER